jgi:hypothetical protein
MRTVLIYGRPKSTRVGIVSVEALLAGLNARFRRQSPGSWFARATVLLAIGMFILNNLAPYFALDYFGPMTMFSGLTFHADNHFLMPKIPLSDADVVVGVVRLAGRNVDTPSGQVFKSVIDWAEEERKLLNLNIVRYHASRTCATGPEPDLRLTLRTQDGRRRDYRNVCAEPSMLRYALLTSQLPCDNCEYFRRMFTSGKLPLP